MSLAESLIPAARLHVNQLFQEKQTAAFVFHNFEQTEEVVKTANKLIEEAGKEGEWEESAKVKLLLAAYFSHTGYCDPDKSPFEGASEFLDSFLREKGISEEERNQTTEILQYAFEAKLPVHPLGNLFHDAYWSFLGKKKFFKMAPLLRLEQEQSGEGTYNLADWEEKLLQLQLDHQFQTRVGREAYGARQLDNIAAQRSELGKAREKTTRQKTGKDFGRGIDTIYRVTLRNHMSLSSIADGKANMIISINSLILSILLTVGGTGLSLTDMGNLSLLVPMLILMLSSLGAIIFAILSAIPKVSGQNVPETEKPVEKRSLMYFGNFLKIPKEDFVDYLRNLKNNQATLYDDLSRDLYNLGLVLQKKYRLLTIAYRLFMYGLILAVLSFIITYFLTGAQTPSIIKENFL